MGGLSFLLTSSGTLGGKFDKHWGTSCTQSLTLNSVGENHHNLEVGSSLALQASKSLFPFAKVILEMEKCYRGQCYPLL